MTRANLDVASLKKEFYDLKHVPVQQRITSFLSHYGVETHGIIPTAEEARTDKRLYQMFCVWFSCNLGIIALSIGAAGPAVFQLGLGHSLVSVVIVDLISCIIPAIFTIFGPKLGMRAMIQSRFSWGYYGVIIPCLLNVFTAAGYLVLNVIVGGQALASVSQDLNDTAGIIIVGTLTLVVTFFGYKVVHWYESIAWIPNLIAFITLLAVTGRHHQLELSDYPSVPPATAATILSFSSLVAASVISWCTFSPDYGIYHDSKASSMKMFFYSYFGFFLSSVPSHMIGVAIAAKAPAIPSWDAAFKGGEDIGGLFGAVLGPVGVWEILDGACRTFDLDRLCCLHVFIRFNAVPVRPFPQIPRYVYTVICTAIVLPIAVVGQTKFYSAVTNIVGIIGYWSTVWAIIVLIEHYVFRRGDWTQYDIKCWNQPRRLPPGFAALFSLACAIGIIVPCMDQVYYVGPLAKAGTGDVGLITGAVVGGLVYVPTRWLERRLTRT